MRTEIIEGVEVHWYAEPNCEPEKKPEPPPPNCEHCIKIGQHLYCKMNKGICRPDSSFGDFT